MSILLFVIALQIFGTIGYRAIEGWTLLNAFYMTAITITTVGFGEVLPLSPEGRMFTVILMIGGIGIVTYVSTSAVQMVVSGELRTQIVMRRREKMLAELNNHYIVCGFGRVGRSVAVELAHMGRQFVIVDQSVESIEHCRQLGYVGLVGDASDEDVLEQAGINRARSLITAVSPDAANVFITLTARSLRADLIIVARANSEGVEPKLRRAGANQVIEPYSISGKRMVSSADHPAVVDFLDVVMHSPELELWLKDVVIEPGSALADMSLRQAHLRSEIGVNILSVNPPGKAPILQPDIDYPLPAGTRLIVLGTPEQFEKLEAWTRPTEKIA